MQEGDDHCRNMAEHGTPSDRRFPDFQRACAGGGGGRIPWAAIEPLMFPVTG